jgi:hypothetical protein
LCLDDFLIDSLDDLTFELHRPRRAEKVLEPKDPWEGSTLGHVSLLNDGDVYRMYYRGHHEPGYSWSEDICTCYAESRDGIHWHKPSLGLIEWENAKENNIVTRGQRGAYLVPFRDDRPGVPSEERYKSFAGNPPYAMASADAIDWRVLQEKPVLPKPRFGIAFWDPNRGEYLAYVRAFQEGNGTARYRNIALASSFDFLRWTDPKLLDYGDAPVEHLYWNTALPYSRAPHLYLGFPMRLKEYQEEEAGKRTDRTDVVFMVSRDGFHFRRYLEAFVRPGQDPHNWEPHVNMLAYGILPTGKDELSLYLTNAAGGKRHLRRLVLRIDGFVSLRAGAAGGQFTTKPLTFSGDRLVLNVSTSAAGSVRVEIQTSDGKPAAGFGLNECLEVFGDSIARTVQWKEGRDMGQLAGKPVRLRFVLKDADLYSFQFQVTCKELQRDAKKRPL